MCEVVVSVEEWNAALAGQNVMLRKLLLIPQPGKRLPQPGMLLQNGDSFTIAVTGSDSVLVRNIDGPDLWKLYPDARPARDDSRLRQKAVPDLFEPGWGR